jgi:hypothetical protein
MWKYKHATQAYEFNYSVTAATEQITQDNQSDIQHLQMFTGFTWEACTMVNTATPKKRKKSIIRNDIAPIWWDTAWFIHAPREEGAKGSVKTPAYRKSFSIRNFPVPPKIYIYICLEMAKSERLISHILVRVTPPVINIAETSRTRNAKNSHLFFCIRHKYATLFYREVNTVEKYLRYESSVQVKPCKFKCQGPPKESSGRVHM